MISLNPRLKEPAERTRLSESFLGATPFQHLLIDDVFDDHVLEAVVADFAKVRHNTAYDDATTRKKHTCDDWQRFPPATFEFISYLNCGAFVSFVAGITGISALTSDPFLLGGGMHETLPGGYLKMHTDFNFHQQLHLDRRINVILFLNRDWQPSWGGELLLSNVDMSQVVAIEPLFNRLVVFNTNDFSFHGQPDPHKFPEGNSRKSIAMYYYANGRPPHEIISQKIGTTYKARHTGDVPLSTRLKEAARLLAGSKRAR